MSGAYVVLSARLRVFALAPNGTEATLYFIEPGETCVLALNCLFTDLHYPAWIQAEPPTTLALIPGAVYRKLFVREVPIQNLTVHALSTLVFRLMSDLELVHSSHHKQRLTTEVQKSPPVPYPLTGGAWPMTLQTSQGRFCSVHSRGGYSRRCSGLLPVPIFLFCPSLLMGATAMRQDPHPPRAFPLCGEDHNHTKPMGISVYIRIEW